MKKFVGAICSAVAGVFTFILLSLNWLSVKDGDSIHAWDIMKDGESIDGYSLFKLSGILLVILAVLLIASAVVVTLQKLNVIKLKFDLNKLNTILLTVFAGISILMIIAAFIMAADMTFTETIMGVTVSVKTNVAIGAWLMTVTAIVTCVIAWIFSRKSTQK